MEGREQLLVGHVVVQGILGNSGKGSIREELDNTEPAVSYLKCSH